ncbi:FAD-dependent oxidoreductase [Extensimonas vulgaris]|uniref:D-amino-acid oxidase n=1 Tax=Extensimonas vulgaris TaxID=1031594 RepID=A0A369AGM1_9BURK|nr:FAD-dependent oxidoreductase [Extensimonas vulgaris]RCX08245.1 glycine oxidase [Extensimonas vulgaris]TWI37482.1 glycine oxidase [Extensimonas vulgaris]TXD13835.1 FAD-dependent oxidoreductase [Extensimonas vulgaris]
MPSSSSIVILGAGLMGRLLAVELARAGHTVEVFDRGGPQAEHAAATVAAAMLAPLAESAVTEPNVVRMGQYALARWPALLGALEQPVFFQQNGTLVVWHRQDAAEAQRLRRVFERTHTALPGLPAPEALDAARLAAAEPALADRFTQGLYLPGEGQLDNRQLLAALAQEMQRLQVRVHWHTPREVGDFAPGTPGQPDWLIDCRGLGARAQWPTLRGVRGEVLRVHAPEVTLQRPTRLVHPRYPIYIAPKQEHLFVIGATEIESEDLSPVSVRSALELLSTAYTVHSGFAEARILEIATQCRPTLPDNLPAIRCSAPGLLEVNGLYRHGYMIAPAVLDAALEWLHTGASPLAERLGLHIVHTAAHAHAAPM